jgi:hypothetical protein
VVLHQSESVGQLLLTQDERGTIPTSSLGYESMSFELARRC